MNSIRSIFLVLLSTIFLFNIPVIYWSNFFIIVLLGYICLQEYNMWQHHNPLSIGVMSATGLPVLGLLPTFLMSQVNALAWTRGVLQYAGFLAITLLIICWSWEKLSRKV